MPIPGNNLRDNRYMSSVPEVREEYYRERVKELERRRDTLCDIIREADDRTKALEEQVEHLKQICRDKGVKFIDD